MPGSPRTARREPAQCHLRPLHSPSLHRNHFEGSRGGRLASRRHAVLRQTTHISTGYPIHHFRGREPMPDSVQSIFLTVTVTPRTVVSNGTARFSSSRTANPPAPRLRGSNRPVAWATSASRSALLSSLTTQGVEASHPAADDDGEHQPAFAVRSGASHRRRLRAVHRPAAAPGPA